MTGRNALTGRPPRELAREERDPLVALVSAPAGEQVARLQLSNVSVHDDLPVPSEMSSPADDVIRPASAVVTDAALLLAVGGSSREAASGPMLTSGDEGGVTVVERASLVSVADRAGAVDVVVPADVVAATPSQAPTTEPNESPILRRAPLPTPWEASEEEWDSRHTTAIVRLLQVALVHA